MKNSPQTTINDQFINKLKFNNYQKARDTSNWTCINRGEMAMIDFLLPLVALLKKKNEDAIRDTRNPVGRRRRVLVSSAGWLAENVGLYRPDLRQC
jgi:hypothetical protein